MVFPRIIQATEVQKKMKATGTMRFLIAPIIRKQLYIAKLVQKHRLKNLPVIDTFGRFRNNSAAFSQHQLMRAKRDARYGDDARGVVDKSQEVSTAVLG